MNIYIPLALLSILFAIFARGNKRRASIIFFVVMLAALVFAALRFEFGPDYFQYRDIYDTLDSIGVAGYLSLNEHIEPLFLGILHAFPNYFLFIAVQSLLWFGSVYLFLRNRYDYRFLWLVVFLLYFDVNNILNNYVAIRTALVGIIFLIALPFLNDKKIIYVLLMMLAFFIHNSSAPLILLVFFNGNKRQNAGAYNYLYILAFYIGVLSFLFGDIISGSVADYLFDLFPQAFGKYSYYMDNVFTERSISIGNFIFLSMRIFIVFMLINGLTKESEPEYILFYKIAILMSLMSILFGNMLMSRFNMNVAPLMIVAYIRTLRYVKAEAIPVLVGSLIVISLFTFYGILHADFAISFLEYHSIIGQPVH